VQFWRQKSNWFGAKICSKSLPTTFKKFHTTLRAAGLCTGFLPGTGKLSFLAYRFTFLPTGYWPVFFTMIWHLPVTYGFVRNKEEITGYLPVSSTSSWKIPDIYWVSSQPTQCEKPSILVRVESRESKLTMFHVDVGLCRNTMRLITRPHTTIWGWDGPARASTPHHSLGCRGVW
jgi:hypothetical protein